MVAEIPDGLRWLAQSAEGAAWLAELPALVEKTAEAWGLRLGEPYAGSHVSFAAPARRDADEVVLKIQWPHPECEHEARALEIWDGDGAVRILEHEASRHALLLERCTPGTHLSDAAPADAVRSLVAILPRLWKPAGAPIRSLADESRGWIDGLDARWERAARPCERRLIDAAAACLRELAPTQGPQVLLHQDLHADNVLAAEREPWLVIDPKPLVGERDFSPAPIIRSHELGHSRRDVLWRLDHLSRELDLDRERVRGWAIGQTVAWSLGSARAARDFETVRWLLAGPSVG